MSESNRISEDLKLKIFQLISTPGLEIEDITKKLHIDHDTLMKILSEEYCKYDLDQGRRLCCRG
ncbi:MAG: hypothetical protein ACFFBP_11790 [Promethearchaeota archaeon]